MRDVCSPINKKTKASPGLDPRPLKGANPKHAAIYNGGGGSSKLSGVARYAPGTLIDGAITIKTPVAIPSERKG
jgi:hypothetical protein